MTEQEVRILVRKHIIAAIKDDLYQRGEYLENIIELIEARGLKTV